MHRKQLAFLDVWLRSKNRKPLIVRGARQVGRSTLVDKQRQPVNYSLLSLPLYLVERLEDIVGAI